MTEAIAIIDNKKVKGHITFTQPKDKNYTLVKFNLKLPRKNSVFACHLHEYGDLRNGCASLGSHWNPTKVQHGSHLHHKKYDYGDMINNIKSDKNGNFIYNYKDKLLRLRGKNHIFGRSIVIHDKPDDLGLGGDKESLITGNAGKRIAYGIIVRYKK